MKPRASMPTTCVALLTRPNSASAAVTEAKSGPSDSTGVMS
jgi:hypothetical protein